MTTEINNDASEKRLGWLPEYLQSWAQNSPFLQLALDQAHSMRDLRITGTPLSTRTQTALVCAMSELLEHTHNGKIMVITPNSDLVLSVGEELERLTAGTGLNLYTQRTRYFYQSDILEYRRSAHKAADIALFSVTALEKLISARTEEGRFKGLADFRCVILLDAETALSYFMPRLHKMFRAFPAVCQRILITHPVTSENQLLSELLRAPVVCKVADDKPLADKLLEEVVYVVEEKDYPEFLRTTDVWSRSVILSGQGGRLEAFADALSALGQEVRMPSFLLPVAIKKTVDDFFDGLLPSLFLKYTYTGVLKGRDIRKITLLGLTTCTEAYLYHLRRLPFETEPCRYVSVLKADELAEFAQIAEDLNRRVRVENQFGYEGIPAEVGATVKRDRLTIRTGFQKGTPEEDTAGPAEDENSPAPVSEAPLEAAAEPVRQHRKRKGTHPFKKRLVRHRAAADENGGEQTAEDRRQPRYGKKPQHAGRKNASRGIHTQSPEAAADSAVNNSEQLQPELPLELAYGARNVRKPQHPRFKDKRPAQERGLRTEQTDDSNSRNGGVQRKKAHKGMRSDKAEHNAGNDSRKSVNKFERKDSRPEGKINKSRTGKPNARRDNRKPAARWNDDNYGNSIYYQPKRQDLRTLRSDQPMHWEPVDPFHPASQALSLPQTMPDEYPHRSRTKTAKRPGPGRRPKTRRHHRG